MTKIEMIRLFEKIEGVDMVSVSASGVPFACVRVLIVTNGDIDIDSKVVKVVSEYIPIITTVFVSIVNGADFEYRRVRRQLIWNKK